MQTPILREGRSAESALFGLDEGQRRSGGGNAHGTLPVPKEAKGGFLSLEFGWHHEASFRSRPNGFGTGAFFLYQSHTKRKKENNHG